MAMKGLELPYGVESVIFGVSRSPMVAMFLFLRIGKEANLLSDWKYEVKIAAVGNITAGIDCHAVSGGQEHTCRGLGTSGGVPEASRDARSFKNQILMEITVHFG